MNAGDALGLLAGLGALNAIRGGREGTGKRFTGLLDMLDGGGAGASGDRFEGGGLISMLGNLFAKPLEAQQRVEDIAARAATRNATPSTTGGSEPISTQPLLDAAPVGTGNPLVDRIIEDRKEQVVMDQPVVPAVTPDVPVVVSDYPDMSMPAIEGYSVPAPAPSEPVGLLSGNQIVPSIPNYHPSVPRLLETAQTRDFLSPITQQDYADYLEYLNTGRYPRG